MKVKSIILTLLCIVLVNLLAQYKVVRLDLTQDKRHTLSPATKQIMRSVDGEITATMYLTGSFNSGFTRLSAATKQLLDELSVYGNLSYSSVNPNDLSETDRQDLQQHLFRHKLHPTAIYENNRQGVSSETIVYPFVLLKYGNREQWVSLLENHRGLSGAENINISIENLEYAFSRSLTNLMETKRKQIVFLEGHGELPEQYTQDVQTALAEFFDVYRGTITGEADCLDRFDAVIVADPQLKFTEADKYIIDRYLMNGGKILWFVNGVQFSEQVLQDEGYTPALALDLNLTDMLFRYGVRINHHLVQDLQCLPVPVDVSRNPEQPQYQPMPWTFAPLLLTSNQSPVTNNLSPVSATFCSDLSAVGDDPKIRHTVLLATSDATHIVAVPSEVDLGDLNIDERLFTISHLPVAISLEGEFPSLFAHRITPEGINETEHSPSVSQHTRQIVVGAGSVIRNDLQQGMPLPAGYDRYSRTQFANRDFVVNSVLWLTDDNSVLQLRQKTIPLRLLNTKAVKENMALVLLSALLAPLLLIAIIGITFMYIRRKRYIR